MEKWDIRPAPTAFDPQRHLLLVKGKMKDVTAIVKKFGALCGRPSPAQTPEGFNYKLYLHGLTAAGRERLCAALDEMLPAAKAAAVKPAAAEPEPAKPPPEVIPPAEPPELVSLAPKAPEAPAAEPPPAETPPAEEPAPAVFAAQGPAPQARPLWGLQEPLDSSRSFDSLMVGAYNRFAHAAATSVVGSPGSMYNPLFLHGPPGVGKTHMIHAIGGGLAAAMTAEGVVLTSGPRLSRAVGQALAEKKLGEVEALLKKAKSLLVDDVHLLAVTDQNRAALAKVFGQFLERGHQVVMTSIYPPRALGALEEALKISLAKGWSVDLKVPGAAVQVEIIQGYLDRHAVNIPNEAVRKLHDKLGANYFEAERWLRRLSVLIKLHESDSPPPEAEDFFPALFDPGPPPGSPDLPTPKELESAKSFRLPAPGADAVNLAVVAPKGQEAMLPWMAARFHEAAAGHGIGRTYRQVAAETYDAGQPFGVPFQIGEMCLRTGAAAALILGPPGESSLASRSAEFSHAVGHILESLDVAMGWIPHRGSVSSGHFLRAHLDFLAPRGAPR